MKLTERQILILEALARFKFLTTNHLQLIFSKKSNSYINSAIHDLKQVKYPLVKSLSFGVIPWKWRLANVHCLTYSGAKFLQQSLGYTEKNTHYPKGRNSFFSRDYFHRIATINFNIRLQKWLANHNHWLTLFHLYFNKSPVHNYRKAMTAVFNGNQWLEPDWIALLWVNNEKHLIIFEQHNGKDTQRAIRQMINHAYALASGVYSDAYEVSKPASIYYVFELESCMKAAIREFWNHVGLNNFSQYFLFKSIESLEQSFYQNWLNSERQQINFLP